MKSSHHAFHLRYGWTAWPADGGAFPDAPDMPVAAWKADGLRLLEQKTSREEIQLIVSAGPDIAPTDIARLLKGRLQHAFRSAGTPAVFSRKICLRAIGENTRTDVETYVRDQLIHAELADPRYRAALQAHAFVQKNVNLAEPSETNSGRYWYNLHVVLVTENRYQMSSETAGIIANACRVPGVAKCSVMPDHVHLAVKASPEQSPRAVAEFFQVTTAKAVRMLGLWKDTFYVGTFGEYGMRAVRG